MVKPGSKDRKASLLITGLELDELQRFVWMMLESFGLDRRIANAISSGIPLVEALPEYGPRFRDLYRDIAHLVQNEAGQCR